MAKSASERIDRVYIGVRESERETFERVADAMGLTLSGMFRTLALSKARELGLDKPAKKRVRKGAR